VKRNHRRILLAATASLPAEGRLPSRMLVLPWGDNHSDKYGTIRVNDTTAAILPNAQKKARRETVHVDFSHSSCVGSPTYRGEPVKLAARRATPQVVPGEGIFLDAIEWNPAAEEHRLDYPEISATPIIDGDGTVLCLESVAICRHGELDGMALPLAAEVVTEILNDNPNNEGTPVDYKKLLCILLGLADTATDQEIQDAATQAADKLKVPDASAADRIAAVAPPDKKPDASAAAPLSADAVGKIITGAIKPVADRLELIERNNITALAIRDGKLIPLGADKLGLADYKALVDSLPAGQVPMAQRTPDQVKALASTGLAALSGDATVEESVRKQLGLTKEQYEAVK
jgi:phage I-like protein